MKKTFILFAFLFASVFSATSFAQSVSEQQASIACKHFLMENYRGGINLDNDLKLQEIYYNENGLICMYRFSIKDLGFVVVSASQSVMPVLAYSFDENFEMIDAVKDLFQHYKQVVTFTEKGDAPASAKAKADWKRYLSSDFSPKAAKTPTRGPLLTTRWNQNKYYNTYCPWDAQASSYYDYRVPNGCVALACSQIMNYHRYPEHATGATTYIPAGYPRQTVFFSQHFYNWDAMCNEPMSYANEISKLVYHFGVAIQMGYTADGSGAQTDEAKAQLSSKFGYDQNIAKYYRNAYLDSADVEEYKDLLKGEIDARRPIYYAGSNQNYSSAHAYVVDGYDENDRFHVNFGWGGSSNGFYALDHFVSGYTNWDYSGEAIVRIYPSGAHPDSYCQGFQRNTASFGYVADGSPTAKPYQANPDCSWMIAVPDAHTYSFKFDRLDVNPDADVVTIYNGPSVESGVKATITGVDLPTETYIVNADSVLITFTSNGSISTNTDYYGFLISYSSDVESQYCSYMPVTFTDWHNTLTDGSPEGTNYRAESNCTWNLNLQYINGYYFAFSKFDLGYGDFVDVYNASTSPATLYKRFDIFNPPTGVEQVNFKKMKVVFVADNWDQKDGFALDYYGISGIDDFEGMNDLIVYPNPATDNIYVDYSLTDAYKVTFRLMDAAGKVIAIDNVEAAAGDNKYSMNVSNLSKGFYMMEISSEKGKVLRKIMVQ